MFNYFQVNIYGLSIRECYESSVAIGNLIGKHVIVDYGNDKYQIIEKVK